MLIWHPDIGWRFCQSSFARSMAFSSEVEPGSCKENASNRQKSPGSDVIRIEKGSVFPLASSGWTSQAIQWFAPKLACKVIP
jgi:hypothetical protein